MVQVREEGVKSLYMYLSTVQLVRLQVLTILIYCNMC